jgi:hypothetical protein
VGPHPEGRSGLRCTTGEVISSRAIAKAVAGSSQGKGKGKAAAAPAAPAEPAGGSPVMAGGDEGQGAAESRFTTTEQKNAAR